MSLAAWGGGGCDIVTWRVFCSARLGLGGGLCTELMCPWNRRAVTNGPVTLLLGSSIFIRKMRRSARKMVSGHLPGPFLHQGTEKEKDIVRLGHAL